MAIRAILKMGNPQLFEISEPVAYSEIAELGDLVSDMIDTMNAAQGAGLAAPQIGVMKRVVVFGFDSNLRYPDENSVPFTVLINPEIDFLGARTQDGWEGCLSVPNMRGLVSRHSKIRYTGFDLNGYRIDRTVSDFHARVVQHECDHLDGILYPMRVSDMRNFGYEDEFVNLALQCPPNDINDT